MTMSALPLQGHNRYEDALKLLDSRRRQARPDTGPPREAGKDNMPEAPTFKGTPSLFNMKIWLRCLGHLDADLDRLNVIHVAGTKGKGSTCAFTASFLKAHGLRTGYPSKVGLYTSPHLKMVQERIQINSQPMHKEIFARYVFEVWSQLDSQEVPKPRYLQFLMLVAVHTFVRENVDAVVCETHNGGEYDATNIFVNPIATGITTIGMDHALQLGPTIENIAWHKSGIFKCGAPAFSVEQEHRVSNVLRRRANEKNVSLEFVDDDAVENHDILAIKTTVQRRNASLAQRLANALLMQKEPKSGDMLTLQDIREGAERLNWNGRFQQIVHNNHTWFLDGAHNEMSVPYAAQWFAEIVAKDLSQLGHVPRVLIFSHISERDGAGMLRTIAKILQEANVPIDLLIISTYEERLDGTKDIQRCISTDSRPFEVDMQKQYTRAWKEYQPGTEVSVELTVEGALNLARTVDRGAGMHTLITGSLYLVGSALRLLEKHSNITPSTTNSIPAVSGI